MSKSKDETRVITKDQFIEAVNFVVSPEGMLGDKAKEIDPMSFMIKSMSVLVVGIEISKKLFEDKKEIEITRDQLRDVIVENTLPGEVAKMVRNKMSISDVLPIALLSVMVLSKLESVLFDEADNA